MARRRARNSGFAAATALVALIAAIGIHRHHDRGVVGSARATATRTAVPRELVSAYRFLTSASTPRRPHSVVRIAGVTGRKVIVSAGTEAGRIGRERVWMVLGHAQTCIEIDDGGSACAPNWLVARRGVFLMLVPVSGAAPTVYGVLPDGAEVTEHAVAVTQSGNAYMVRPTSRRPGRFTIHTRQGPTIVTTVPPAAGQPQ